MAPTPDLTDRVLRALLLSKEVYGDDNADPTHPPFGFDVDAAASVDQHARYFRFFLDNVARLEWVLGQLQDEQSRQLLYSLVLFRILGYRRARVEIDRDAFQAARAESLRLPNTPSLLNIQSTSRLLHYEISNGDKVRRLDCLRVNVFFSFLLRQYYFARSNIDISPSPGDVVIDAGACFGDTAIGFADAVGDGGRVCSFEVLSSHLEIIRHNLKQNQDLRNITLYPFALGEWSQEGEVAEGPPNPGYSLIGAGEQLPVRTLDSLVADGTIPRVDFLKMDIEGYELAALRGAAKTLRRFRPKLAISIYHKWDDYWTIPEFIASLGVGYRFYLANYTLSDGETILYATCAEPA